MAIMQNNKVYDFEVYAPQAIGSGWKRVQCVGCMPYETAVMLAGDLDSIHASVFATGNLPNGTPDDPRQTDYYRFKKSDGSFVILGETWIDANSVQEIEISNAVAIIPNVTTADIVRLRDMFRQAGFIDVELSFNAVIQN